MSVARPSWCRSSRSTRIRGRAGDRRSCTRRDPAEAAELVEAFAVAIEARGVEVGRGVFGAEMEIELVNDGPFTMWFDTAQL